MRPFRRLVLLTFASVVLGCGSDEQTASDPPAENVRDAAGDTSRELEDQLAEAKLLSESNDFDAAADKLYGLMIRYPVSDEAKLLTAKVESARGNLEAAIEVADSVALKTRFGTDAVELRYRLLDKNGRHQEAVEALLVALEAKPEVARWRREAWRLLNYLGRRQEASAQALALCRLGLAGERELQSLIRRGVSFPTPEMAQKDPRGANLFADGLGKARWFFSLGEYANGIKQLEAQSQDGFQSVAGEALYGRLLAESQNWERFASWHANVSSGVVDYSDYWSALGTYFLDNRQDEAAVRALLEAISRDPTDRVCYQRVSKGLSALGNTEDAAQFRVRGVDVAQTQRLIEDVREAPTDREKRTVLARHLLALGRPFETLAWTATSLPINAIGPRQQIAQQRSNLLSDPSANRMAMETALIQLEPNDFAYRPALESLLSQGTRRKSEATVPQRDVLATPRLVNRAKAMKLDFQWYKDVEIDLVSIPIHESLGGGIAVIDFDLDGRHDLYFAQGSGDPPTDQCTRSSKLLRHQASAFSDITVVAGAEDYNYSSGLAAGDVNQDGFPDLFLGSLGHNRLLINNGDGTFSEATNSMGDFPDRFTASIAIGDINGDRLPDLFESNYIEMEGGFALPTVGPDGKLKSPTPLAHYPEADRWFENRGDGEYQVHEITRDIANPGTSLGVVITDVESDGKNEVFVGIDVRPNHLLVQDGSNSFVNRADVLGLANGFEGAANGCMGIATGDFNRDGRFDMQIANYSLEPANLYLQNETGDFTDYSVRYGLAEFTNPYVGFGTKAVDIDRNGFLDFIVTNGHIFDMRDEGEPYQMEPQLLMSDGRGLQLAEVDDDSDYWNQTYLGRTIAMTDYDRDGATDFVVNHLDQPVALLRDETDAGGGWLQFELVGTESERDAIGARLVLSVGDSKFTQWVTAGDGYFCSDEAMVAFAFDVDDQDSDFSLEVTWPSGKVSTYDAIESGERYLLVENADGVTKR